MKRCALIALLCLSSVAFGQETRSTLTGHVSDATGARIPDATIRVTDTDTGVVTNGKSNSAGDYTVSFLQPGTYRVDATHEGFKNYTHTGLVLQTEQTVTENITLPVGAVSETVTVEGNTPLVDTATASTGQTLTAEEVEDLPSNGRSPLGFARDEYGVVSKGKHSQSQTRPFDNSAADDFSVGGGNSASNELLLNGVPNMQDSSRTAGFSPELDSVDAVRVDEFTSDASFGDTSGGVVNITTKSGTNQFHGTASEYYSGSRPLTAKPYFTPAGGTVQSTHFNQFGGTIGGPIYIPHIVNGHDRMFFEYAFEGYIGTLPATFIGSVPTQAERTGDFSALLAISPQYQLYNPYTSVATTTTVGGKTTTTYSRSKITGNVFSNAGLTINPIAAQYLALFPLPNYNGASTKPDGTNNFFANDPTSNNYKSNAARVDFVINPKNRLYGELHRSTSFTGQSNVFNSSATGTTGEVQLWGGSVDDTHTFNSSTVLTARLGFSRSVNSSEPNSYGTDPSSIGFPSYISTNSGQHALPRLTFSESGNSNLIPSISTAPGNSAAFDEYQLFASFNKVWGRHTLKIGPDIRLNKDAVYSPGNANGTYTFGTGANDFVTSGLTGTVQPFGSTFALLALGLPTSGTFDVNTKFLFNNWYYGGFIQDDWKLLPNLTINLGLRLEHETPIEESGNRMTAGWNPTIQNAASAAAAAAYAKSPSLLPASQFTPTGGLLYASSSNRYAYHTAPLYVSPRIGFAYSPGFSHGKTAIRLGWGIFDNPFNDYYQSQSYGYSQTTAMNVSNDNNQTVLSNLSDPFPSFNPIQQPTGNALGINTNLGNKIVFYGDTKVAYSLRSSIDVQQQFGHNWLLDVGYITTHQVHQSFSNAVNAGSGTVPVQYLSNSRYYDPVLTANYNAGVPNPYKGTLIGPGATTNTNTASTLQQSALLWPYSEYTSVTQQLVPQASANYNALLVRLEKRMAHGLDFNINYTYSRNLGAQSQLNNGGALWYGETASDFPNSLHLTAIYQLPFGRGRMLASNVNRLTDEFIGGWEVTSIWSFDSGTPYSWGNVIYNGNWHDINNHPHNPNGAAFNTSVFDTRTCANGSTTSCNNTVGSTTFNPNIQPNAYNNRTFPLFAWRSDVTNNWDFSVLKNFQIHERLIVQPRVDAFNAFNRVQFSAPNLTPTSTAFGDISGQQNTNRQLQGGIHILF